MLNIENFDRALGEYVETCHKLSELANSDSNHNQLAHSIMVKEDAYEELIRVKGYVNPVGSDDQVYFEPVVSLPETMIQISK